MITIQVKKICQDAVLPRYSHLGPAGDLCADLFTIDDVEVIPGQVVQVSTGICLEIPEGYGALVEDRSGLSCKGLTTLAGVIDTGYRGEIRVVVANVGTQPVQLKRGDRIAQLRVVKRYEVEFVEVEELSGSVRGGKGFGSTGT